jgi:hypothetical protein
VLAHTTHRSVRRCAALQGLPSTFDLPGLSRSAKLRAIGNGVPVPVAYAIAIAIRDRHVTSHARLCACNCGRPLTGQRNQIAATPACRKRLERSRRQSPAAPSLDTRATPRRRRPRDAEDLEHAAAPNPQDAAAASLSKPKPAIITTWPFAP